MMATKPGSRAYTYMCFVDYEKAFDRVDWKKLMNIFRRLGEYLVTVLF